MRIRNLGLFVATLMAGGLLGSDSQPVEVTVRAIDGKTGHPLVGYRIQLDWVDGIYPNPGLHPLAEAKTGPDGTVIFHLDDPPPETLFIEIGHPGATVGCTRLRRGLSTDEVLRSGVVGDNICDPRHKIKQKFSAKPGEVVIFARKKGFWDSFPG
jgi:hypothetical protein